MTDKGYGIEGENSSPNNPKPQIIYPDDIIEVARVIKPEEIFEARLSNQGTPNGKVGIRITGSQYEALVGQGYLLSPRNYALIFPDQPQVRGNKLQGLSRILINLIGKSNSAEAQRIKNTIKNQDSQDSVDFPPIDESILDNLDDAPKL